MKKRKNRADSAAVLQIAMALATLVILVILSSISNAAVPHSGFYPPLPEEPTATPPPTACDLTEEFEATNDLITKGWVMRNNSLPLGNTNWFQGNTTVFGSHAGGATNSYIAANFQNGSNVATISDWLITPPVTLQNGAQLSFWTRTVNFPLYPDRLQVRMSLNGTSSDVGSTATSVGDFTVLLFDVNPAYSRNGYPSTWTNIVVTLSGLALPVEGRLAFRYFAENGGPDGVNSDYIGIDSVRYCCTSKCGFPTPTPPVITPTPAPTGTPCSCGGLNVSGNIANCSNVSRAAPVPGVTLTLSGSYVGSTSSNQDGRYGFSISMTVPFQMVGVTPSKAALAPGSNGIDGADVLAVLRHFLNIALLPTGCGRTAADVDGDGTITGADVVAIQRFYLGFPTEIGNVGNYRFTPANRSYMVVNFTFTNQDYATLVFGDVAGPFVQ